MKLRQTEWNNIEYEKQRIKENEKVTATTTTKKKSVDILIKNIFV